jgi:hypothetical protein
MVGVPVPPLADDFGQVEQLLQIQLKAPKLVVTECYDITNPHLTAQFTIFCKSISPVNTVSVFIPTSQIEQSVQEIATKGLKIDPESGFKFSVGRFDFEADSEEVEVLRFIIALGNTLNHQPSEAVNCEFMSSSPTSADLKSGYQSLCVGSTSEYVIFDPAQVKGCHLIKFAGGGNLAEVGETVEVCDICQKNQATIWCVNDSAKLCKECDAESHKHNHILAKHRRIPLSDARALMECCPDHPDSRVEYYCRQCQAPICVSCKMTGSHSVGETASHPLIPIGEAYNQAVQANEKEDPIITLRKTAVQEKLINAEKALQEILDNQQAVENEIRRKANAAIQKVRQLAGERALIVRSVQTELQRKQDEMDTIAQSIAVHKKVCGPLAYLRASSRHAVLVSTFRGVSDLPPDVSVRGDLVVNGDLDVIQARDGYFSLVAANEESSGPIFETLAQEVSSTTGSESPIHRLGLSGLEITSIALVAQRREQANRERGIELTVQPFQGGRIIAAALEAKTLFLALPFRVQPLTHLLFSSSRDGRSIKKMHELIDGIGITLILVQKGQFRFGGFAASKWNCDGRPFGDASGCFLFSLSQDAIIGYQARSDDPCVLWASNDIISFGRRDLVLSGDFDECSAELENNYGVGWERGSTEAQTFLAGQSKFSADEVEVWGFFTVEQE